MKVVYLQKFLNYSISYNLQYAADTTMASTDVDLSTTGPSE